MEETKSIAVLITCHNRKPKTLACLEALHQCIVPNGYVFVVYLVDDGSSDGTGEAVKNQFPKVNVIPGDGNLFWNRGMRLAWETAAKTKEYDYYLWLNDDTILDCKALVEILECNQEVLNKNNNSAIITGTCKRLTDQEEFSYGGRTDFGAVIPNGQIQSCKYINGNAVLVPKEVYQTIGNLSNDYTHTMGDFDYGLRAIQAGYNCYTTKSYIALCPTNEGVPSWCNPKIPLVKRWKHLQSPNGLNIKEYNTFRKKFWGWKWLVYAIKAYLKTLSPKFYKMISIK